MQIFILHFLFLNRGEFQHKILILEVVVGPVDELRRWTKIDHDGVCAMFDSWSVLHLPLLESVVKQMCTHVDVCNFIW